MQEIPIGELEDKLGVVTKKALQEPVSITDDGNPSLVVTSAGEYEFLKRVWHEHLKAEIQKGIDDLENGRSTVCKDSDELHEFFEDIKRRGRDRLAEMAGQEI